MFVKFLHHRLQDPDETGTGGGAVDRGDDWTPTDDDADTAAATAAAEAEATAAAAALAKGAKADEEEEEEEDKEAAKKAKAKDNRIPAARHKEILDRERARADALAAENARLKGQTTQQSTNAKIAKAETDLVDLEKAYAKQVTDGKADEAAVTMSNIRRLERAINEQNSIDRESAAVERAVESVRYDTTCDRLEAAFPVLDTKHDDYDEKISAEVIDLSEAYQLKGLKPSAALQKAASILLKPSTAKQQDAVDVTPRVDVDAVKAKRKEDATDKLTKALGKQPPNAAKVGLDSDKAGGGATTAKDVMKMSEKEFNAIDEETLSRMRGDAFAPS